MKDLTRLCSGLGLEKVRTHIQSGNVIFESSLSEDAIRTRMEEALTTKMGKQIDVMVRTSAEMRGVLDRNPFPDKEPAKDQIKGIAAPGGEKLREGKREIYIYYPNGMGRSKLKLPLNGAAATLRNMNTISKLAALAEE